MKDLVLRYRRIKNPISIYDISALGLIFDESMINPNYSAGCTLATLSKKAYVHGSLFEAQDTIVNTKLLGTQWDCARPLVGDDIELAAGHCNTAMFYTENTPIFMCVWHQSVGYQVHKITSNIIDIIVNSFNAIGFNVVNESNDLKFIHDEKKKKFSSVRKRAIGEWFSITAYFNLTVDTNIMELVINKDVVKDGKYKDVRFADIIGGLFEVKDFDVDVFFSNVAHEIADYFRLALVNVPATQVEFDLLHKRIETTRVKDPTWVKDGCSPTEIIEDRSSEQEAKDSLGIVDIDIGRPPPMQYPEDIDKFPEFKAKLEARNDPILTPHKEE